MKLALRKRPVSTEQVDGAIERMEEKLLTHCLLYTSDAADE